MNHLVFRVIDQLSNLCPALKTNWRCVLGNAFMHFNIILEQVNGCRLKLHLGAESV